MLIHLPVVENRIAEYATRFAPHGAGWVYYGPRLDGGVPVSDTERTGLIAEHSRLLRRAERVIRWWLPIAIVGYVAFAIWSGTLEREPSPWEVGPILLLPMPWVLLEFRRAERLADELAGRRMPIMPPRGRLESARLRMVALPVIVPSMLLLLSVALAVQSRPWVTGQQRLWLAEALVGCAGALLILWIKRRARPRG